MLDAEDGEPDNGSRLIDQSIEEKENDRDEQLHRAWCSYIEMMMAANKDQQKVLQYRTADIRDVFDRAFSAI